MKRILLAAGAVALTVGGLVPLGMSPAAADPATTGGARGYGVNANLAGTAVIDEGGLAEATLPPQMDDTGELIVVPADPLAVSGTFTGEANAHTNSDVPTSLEQVTHNDPGPYNLRAVGLTEGLEVLLAPGGPSLLSASAVRGEAVGVCRNGTAVYEAASEIVDLNVGGTDLPLNAPLTDIVDLIEGLIDPLASIVDVERDQVVETATGASVTALHVSVLSAVEGIAIPGAAPLLDVVVGRAEVAGLTCTPSIAQCADNQDNDGDGVIDRNDPGCINNGVYDPNDNDERNECVDGVDNEDPEDTLADFGSDPGCTSAQDDDETDPLPRTSGGVDELPRTGADLSTSAPIAVGMSILALAAVALRRRSRA